MKALKESVMLSPDWCLIPRPRRAAPFCLTLAGALAASSCLQPLLAQSPGPFAPFAGGFRGSGAVVGTDGRRERISCRSSGSVGERGESLSETMVCASDSYRFDIRTHAVAEGGAVRGQWQETTRGVSGAFVGRVSGEQFSGNVSGGGFTAQFSLRTGAHRQTFLLRPQGGEVASVEVVLSR
jgi:hypothetical protein